MLNILFYSKIVLQYDFHNCETEILIVLILETHKWKKSERQLVNTCHFHEVSTGWHVVICEYDHLDH